MQLPGRVGGRGARTRATADSSVGSLSLSLPQTLQLSSLPCRVGSSPPTHLRTFHVYLGTAGVGNPCNFLKEGSGLGLRLQWQQWLPSLLAPTKQQLPSLPGRGGQIPLHPPTYELELQLAAVVALST